MALDFTAAICFLAAGEGMLGAGEVVAAEVAGEGRAQELGLALAAAVGFTMVLAGVGIGLLEGCFCLSSLEDIGLELFTAGAGAADGPPGSLLTTCGILIYCM